MAGKSMLGFIISIIGVILIALSFDPIREASKLNLPEILTPNILMIIGIIIVAIGLFLSLGGNKFKKLRDLPIYEGKNIVGYRRHK